MCLYLEFCVFVCCAQNFMFAYVKYITFKLTFCIIYIRTHNDSAVTHFFYVFMLQVYKFYTEWLPNAWLLSCIMSYTDSHFWIFMSFYFYFSAFLTHTTTTGYALCHLSFGCFWILRHASEHHTNILSYFMIWTIHDRIFLPY